MMVNVGDNVDSDNKGFYSMCQEIDTESSWFPPHKLIHTCNVSGGV